MTKRVPVFLSAFSALVVIRIAFTPWQPAEACSRILWNDNELGIFVGRTMDWPETTEPILTVFPHGMWCAMTDILNRESLSKIAATLNLVYPPGIAVVVPGERYTERAAPMPDYFRMFEESYARFPGFGNEIQGVYPEQVDGKTKLFTDVVKES